MLQQQFSAQFEKLHGKVHLVPNAEAAARTALEIALARGARNVALGAFDGDLAVCLAEAGASSSLRVLRPPYPALELPGFLNDTEVGIGFADWAIAETGTLVEVTGDDAIRLVSSLPRTYVGIVHASRIVRSLQDAAPLLREVFTRGSGATAVSFISGPSRTGDIEMKLALGVHGPEEAHAVIVDDLAAGAGDDG